VSYRYSFEDLLALLHGHAPAKVDAVGGHINGRAGLEGTMLGPAIFSGRVAGGWAAQAAGHGRGFVGKPNRS
jgi:hypothetical protein